MKNNVCVYIHILIAYEVGPTIYIWTTMHDNKWLKINVM